MNIHGVNFSIYQKAKTITIHAKGITLVASSFCTDCSTWVLMLQFLWEQLQSINSALNFFQILYTYTAEVIKRIKTASHLTKINSTEIFTKDLVLKFLPETSNELNILQKNFQDLTHYDKLVIQLT